MTVKRSTLREATDTALMLEVRQGDEFAFEELYRRYHRRLLNFFHGMGRDAQLAEDLCHETFMRVWKLRVRYAPTGSVAAYLFTFARYIWLERCRRVKRHRRAGIPVSLDGQEQLAVAPRGSRPDEMAWHSELGAEIFAALEKLPDDQRMAFVMRDIEGVAMEDIAAVMRCPVNTVRSRKILAVKKLRQALQGVFA
jgi:RNA polymerase sigma-70 factor, ECF subfamily